MDNFIKNKEGKEAKKKSLQVNFGGYEIVDGLIAWLNLQAVLPVGIHEGFLLKV